MLQLCDAALIHSSITQQGSTRIFVFASAMDADADDVDDGVDVSTRPGSCRQRRWPQVMDTNSTVLKVCSRGGAGGDVLPEASRVMSKTVSKVSRWRCRGSTWAAAGQDAVLYVLMHAAGGGGG